MKKKQFIYNALKIRNYKYCYDIWKLDGVGPVDNRPSTE